MVVTEGELREIWGDGENPFPTFPPGTRFTPAAQDFIKAHNIQVRFETAPNFTTANIPFGLEGKEHTMLHDRLGTLYALVLLVAAEARRYQLPRMATSLNMLAEHCREIQSASQNDYPIPSHKRITEQETTNNTISGADDHIILYWLKYLQAVTAEIIAAGLEVYPPSEKSDLFQALNQLSNDIFQLELLFKAGTIGWGINGYR
ncbi:MAG: hypothetical protein MUO64_08705 [Anaerolineales bacterium]|nr:hypothetical protein [Anaerolineales bacterium]